MHGTNYLSAGSRSGNTVLGTMWGLKNHVRLLTMWVVCKGK